MKDQGMNRRDYWIRLVIMFVVCMFLPIEEGTDAFMLLTFAVIVTTIVWAFARCKAIGCHGAWALAGCTIIGMLVFGIWKGEDNYPGKVGVVGDSIS